MTDSEQSDEVVVMRSSTMCVGIRKATKGVTTTMHVGPDQWGERVSMMRESAR